MSATDAMSPIAGLSAIEVRVLAILAEGGNANGATTLYSAQRDADGAGITRLGFNLGVRRLAAKSFIEQYTHEDERDGELYGMLSLNNIAWSWLDANEDLFVLHRSGKEGADEVPF